MVAIEYTKKDLEDIAALAQKLYGENDPRIPQGIPADAQYAEAVKIAEETVRAHVLSRSLDAARAAEATAKARAEEKKEEKGDPTAVDAVADFLKRHGQAIAAIVLGLCLALAFAMRPEKKPEAVPTRYAAAHARYEKEIKTAKDRLDAAMKASALRYAAAKACQDLRASGGKCEIQ